MRNAKNFFTRWICVTVAVGGLILPLIAAAAEGPTLECFLEPSRVVEISSPVHGVVDSITVDRSDTVAAGQTVVMLESSVQAASADLARSRAEMDGEIRASQTRLQFARRKQTRIDKLYKQKSVAFHEMDEADTEVALAQLDLSHAEDNRRIAELEAQQAAAALALRTVQSPVGGIVVERYRSQGEFVDEQPILKVVQTDPLYVEAFAPVELFGRLKAGMTARIYPETSPEETSYPAAVTVIDRVVDPLSGTFGVRLELPNPNLHLPSGLKCTAQFEAL
jgi:RND family efflux transporter MFP subunit